MRIYILGLLALLPMLGLGAQQSALRPYLETCPLITEEVRSRAIAELDSLTALGLDTPISLPTSEVASISPRIWTLVNNSPILVVLHDLHPEGMVGDSYLSYYDSEWKSLGDMELMAKPPMAEDFLPRDFDHTSYEAYRLLQLLSPLYLYMRWTEDGTGLVIEPRLPLSLEDQTNKSLMAVIARLQSVSYEWNGRELKRKSNTTI